MSSWTENDLQLGRNTSADETEPCNLPLRVRGPPPKAPVYPSHLRRYKKPPPRARRYIAILPKWLTGKELETMKATAKSLARHGNSYVLNSGGNMDNRQFEFMNSDDRKFVYFHSLVAAYRDDLRTEESESGASESELADYEASFHRFFVERQKLHEGSELVVIDAHEFLLLEQIRPPESEPKRQKVV